MRLYILLCVLFMTIQAAAQHTSLFHPRYGYDVLAVKQTVVTNNQPKGLQRFELACDTFVLVPYMHQGETFQFIFVWRYDHWRRVYEPCDTCLLTITHLKEKNNKIIVKTPEEDILYRKKNDVWEWSE